MDIERVKSTADGLLQLAPDEAKAALRQYELKRAAEGDGEAPVELSQPLSQYLDHEPEVPPILVLPALVVRGGVTMTVGRAGKGKTMMNLNRLLCWSGGRAYFPGEEPLTPTKPLRILTIECEGAAVMFHRKLKLMFESGGFTLEEMEEARRNFHVWGDGGYSGLKLDNQKGYDDLRREVDRIKPDLVFIEPLRFLYTGEENSSTEINTVMDRLVAVSSEFEAGVIISHHERKGGVDEDGEMMSLARGSTAIEGAVAVMENFKAVKGGDFRELSWSKNRYEESPPTMRLHWDHSTHWYSLIPAGAGSADVLKVLNEAANPMGVADIASETGESHAKTRRDLARLLDEEPPRIARFNVPGQGYLYRIDGPEGEGIGY